jgi:hypothetical protein
MIVSVKKEVMEKVKPIQKAINEVQEDAKEEIAGLKTSISAISKKVDAGKKELSILIDSKVSSIKIEPKEVSPDTIIESINKGTIKIKKERVE